ncbi:MAG: preprotein translocase subunit SecE [Candidatus Nomurabacteria bacterium]|nr:preprotein translocase subunit SecE [Candidatus Nomurabacteria bacterium]
MKKIINYFKKTREEMTHVVWPTWRTALALTGLVIAIAFVLAYFMGVFDQLFAFLLGKII